MNDTLPTQAETYGYGFLATFITTFVSALGIIVFGLVPKRHTEVITGFLGSMAVGALSGDAILHLIPQALGLHSHHSDHSTHDQDHDHDHTLDSMTMSLRLTTVLIGIYVFYLIDIIVDKLIKQLHARSHQFDNTLCEIDVIEIGNKNEEISTNIEHKCNCEIEEANGGSVKTFKNVSGIRHICRKTIVCIKEITAYAWCLLLADTIHNLADGVALGAAFATDLRLGLTTSLAVFFHELPHELGDFAVLLKSGLSKKQALFLNVATGLPAFIGFFIGAVVSRSITNAMVWIIAFTGGVFLYVSLCGILPELSASRKSCSLAKQILVYIGGLTVGLGLMIALTFIEHDLHSI